MSESADKGRSTPDKNPVTPPAASAEITVSELKAALDNREDFVLLDVRTDAEYRASHVEGTYVMIPHLEVMERLSELPAARDTYIYCFCRSGRRSAYVTDNLRKAGYVNAYNVVGGILAWTGAGYPLAGD